MHSGQSWALALFAMSNLHSTPRCLVAMCTLPTGMQARIAHSFHGANYCTKKASAFERAEENKQNVNHISLDFRLSYFASGSVSVPGCLDSLRSSMIVTAFAKRIQI